MYIVTNSQMKAIEQKAIKCGVPSLLLMENAALSLTELIIKNGFRRVLVFCGKGNNGGDGLACARQLFARDVDVKIIFIGNKTKATEDCKTNLNAALSLNIPILFDNDIEDLAHLRAIISEYDLIVDALVGTGLESTLREPLLSIVQAINSSGKPVYSADCPTGVSTESGEDFAGAIYAAKTVTFHLPKIGLLLYPACEHTGELEVGNISLNQNTKTKICVLSKDDALALMPKRQRRSDKSTYGRVFAFVGCDSITGAAVLSLKSAYKAGAGLVYGYTTKGCADVVRHLLPEAVVSTLPEVDGYISKPNTDIEKASVVLAGCGLGNNSITHAFLKELLGKVTSPLVLDADGLNIIAANEDLKTALPENTVVTPHPKEMSRLTSLSVDEIRKDPINTALEFSKKYGVVTVLKDFRTIITSPCGDITINLTGTPAMSKGGSGDCLAGIISALIAQGLTTFDAAQLGCYISGKAGETAESKLSKYGVLASDIAECIPFVFQ